MSGVVVAEQLVEKTERKYESGDSRSLAAFLPAALEIQEMPPNPAARVLAWALLMLFVIAVTWVWFGKVNVVASAEGKIIPSARVKQVQPLAKGVVSSILVEEGDYVEAGQPLVELDATITGADLSRLEQEWATVNRVLAVNEGMIVLLNDSDKAAGISLETLPFQMRESESEEEQLFYRQMLLRRWQEYEAQLSALDETLRGTRAELGAVQEEVRKLELTLPIATERAQQLALLKQKDFVSETEYLAVEEARISQQQDLLSERQRSKQLQAQVRQVQEQMRLHTAQTYNTILTEIAQQRQQKKALQEELKKARDLNNKQILVAPVAGRVQDLAVSTVGGVVTDAQQLMVIVPADQQLMIEAYLENKDIGFVEEGMPAEVKVHTFPFTRYGVIEGSVKTISDDAIVDEVRGLIYRMQVGMDRNTILVNGKSVNLMPGMAVTVEVRTGERRVVEFFMAPLITYGKEALRER